MLDFFETATTTDNDYGLFKTLAVGYDHTDPMDACDPVTTTRTLQIGTDWYAKRIVGAIYDQVSVEAEIIEALREYFQPNRCHCAYDCCGCRTGYSVAKHVAGAVFIVQIKTSRNY